MSDPRRMDRPLRDAMYASRLVAQMTGEVQTGRCGACRLTVPVTSGWLVAAHWHRLGAGPVEGALYIVPPGGRALRVLCPGVGMPEVLAWLKTPSVLGAVWDPPADAGGE